RRGGAAATFPGGSPRSGPARVRQPWKAPDCGNRQASPVSRRNCGSSQGRQLLTAAEPRTGCQPSGGNASTYYQSPGAKFRAKCAAERESSAREPLRPAAECEPTRPPAQTKPPTQTRPHHTKTQTHTTNQPPTARKQPPRPQPHPRLEPRRRRLTSQTLRTQTRTKGVSKRNRG